MKAVNQPGVLADVTRVLGEHDISIDAIEQERAQVDVELADVIILTHVTREKRMDAALAQLNNLPGTMGTIKRIRVENFT